MSVSCCIVGCPTVVGANHVHRLYPFPSKDSPEYTVWRNACIESESHINMLKNPLICPMHFAFFPFNQKPLQPTDIPELFLTSKDIELLKQWQSINQLVAEWVNLTQHSTPGLVVNANMLKTKAEEVANVMKMYYFDVNSGWLQSFEVFLYLNGIRAHWKEKISFHKLSSSTSETKPKCAIRGCPSCLLDSNEVQMYIVANNDEALDKKWMQACSEIALASESLNLCSLHFSPQDIGAQGLCENALPSLNLDSDIFLSKVVRQWVLEHQYLQNISRQTCYKISREVRMLLGMPKSVRADWIKFFKYRPIKADSNGLIRHSKQYTESGIIDTIKKLVRKEHQLLIKPINDTAQDDCEKLQMQDAKRWKTCILGDSKHGLIDKQNIKAEDLEDFKSEERSTKYAIQVLEDCDVNEAGAESIWSKREFANNFEAEDNTNYGKLPPFSTMPIADNLMDMSLKSYGEALEYLKPLQMYATEQEEHFSVLGLLKQLQEVFENSSGTSTRLTTF